MAVKAVLDHPSPLPQEGVEEHEALRCQSANTDQKTVNNSGLSWQQGDDGASGRSLCFSLLDMSGYVFTQV